MKKHLRRSCQKHPADTVLESPAKKHPADTVLESPAKKLLVDYTSAEEEGPRDPEEPEGEEGPIDPEEGPRDPEEPEGEEGPIDPEESPRDPLNLDALARALPWAEYTGISSDTLTAARQQRGGNPLFEFDFAPLSQREWKGRVKKTVSRAQLRQRREPDQEEDLGGAIATALEKATLQQLQETGALPEDKVFLAMTPHGFEHAYQTVEFPVQEVMEGSSRFDALLRKLAGKLNSNEAFHADQGFTLDLTLVRPMGTGRGRNKELRPGRMPYALSRSVKQSIVPIHNNDELCCARAIVTMRARLEWELMKKQIQEEENKETIDPDLLQTLKTQEKALASRYNTLRLTKPETKKQTLQSILAKKLHLQAGVPEGPCGEEELDKFQAFLTTQDPPIQLKVFTDLSMELLYPNTPKQGHVLFLLKSEDHFDGLTSVKGFFARSYWCNDCDRAFNTDDAAHHSCQGKHCFACGANPCPDRFGKAQLSCEDCHGKFFGPSCFNQHKSNGTCEAKHTCTTCFARYSTEKDHTCWQVKCGNCKKVDDLRDHQCFIQPVEDEGGRPPIFVYADIEAMVLPDGSFQPNLLCYQTSRPGSVIQTLKGPLCVKEFIQALTKLAWIPVGPKKKRERPVTILFHNLKGFDGVFLLQELYRTSRRVTHQNSMGAKVLTFKAGPLTFKDSLCFLPYPLSAFPKTFGITETKKGYFPHTFNTPDHQGYVGPLPALQFFDPDGMSPAKKAELVAWHTEQEQEMARTGAQYDFQAELEAYCHSDVKLLKAGCEAFVAQFKQEADFNPFERCATIASACNLYWRQSIEEDLPSAKIAVRPLHGWKGALVNHSLASLEWLTYRESLLPSEASVAERIRHARNGGEKRVKTSKGLEYVDGWDKSTKTVYEFLGCLWHGCPRCHRHKRDIPQTILQDRTPEQAYQATLAKLKRLQERYRVESLWECEWAEMKKQPTISSMVSGLSSVDPLQPRDAFFGGRTGAVSLHYDTTGTDEKIFYVDVTSLYPWVNKRCVYPLGHPEIIFNPSLEEFDEYFGLAKVTILPPAELFHPVLPVRGHKLTFPLCGACVQEQQDVPLLERSSVCHHSPQERALVGTWCTPEIQKAREVGYELQTVHEVWHFKESEQGLFAEYVNTWLRIKTQATGWPSNRETEEQRQAFLQEYEEKEDIPLEETEMKENPGLRATAKLMLNSFWGKFGQRENLPQVTQCVNLPQLYEVLKDDTLESKSIRFCTDDVLEVTYVHKDEALIPNNRTNIFIACFTTCHARLKLYSYLETLGDRVLYYDTDSVIYRADSPQLPIGEFLGDLTDELKGDTIVEFISGGAKNYAYRTAQGKTECKVRGFTLNTRGQSVLNFESMKRTISKVLQGEKETPMALTNPTQFKIDATKKRVSVGPLTKRYQIVFDKRVVEENGRSSKPFGFTQSVG